MMVADTDVLIDFLHGKGDFARRVAIELETTSLCTTAITAFELRSGARTARQRRGIEALLDAMTILPFGATEARLAAEIRQKSEAQGQPIGMADYMIAATCMAADSTLLTRNRRHFERVQGLRLGGQGPT